MNQSPYMTIKEVAAHYRLSLSTAYSSRGDLADLKRVRLAGKILVTRASVEMLDRKLARMAKAVNDPVNELRGTTPLKWKA